MYDGGPLPAIGAEGARALSRQQPRRDVVGARRRSQTATVANAHLSMFLALTRPSSCKV
jgi:hypothetical protein